jgi:hypothetical protein
MALAKFDSAGTAQGFAGLMLAGTLMIHLRFEINPALLVVASATSSTRSEIRQVPTAESHRPVL